MVCFLPIFRRLFEKQCQQSHPALLHLIHTLFFDFFIFYFNDWLVFHKMADRFNSCHLWLMDSWFSGALNGDSKAVFELSWQEGGTLLRTFLPWVYMVGEWIVPGVVLWYLFFCCCFVLVLFSLTVLLLGIFYLAVVQYRTALNIFVCVCFRFRIIYSNYSF